MQENRTERVWNGGTVLLFPADREGVFSFSTANRDGGANAGDAGLERGGEGVK
jgi:hypothetical protein